jgi:hypothetical protein
MVPTQRDSIFAAPWYENSSAIANIRSIADFSND